MSKAGIAITLTTSVTLIGCASEPEPVAQVPAPNYAAEPEPLPPVSINEGSSSVSTPPGSGGEIGSGTPGSYEPEPLPPAQPAKRTYVIRKGDTFYGIARREYGNGQRWVDIAQLNPSLDPKRLKIGTEIVLP